MIHASRNYSEPRKQRADNEEKELSRIISLSPYNIPAITLVQTSQLVMKKALVK